jgi:hypothetical protein
LFQPLLTPAQNLGIIDYSLSQTTLEQVFLSFASMQKNADTGASLGFAAGAPALPPVPAHNMALQEVAVSRQ